MTLESLAGKYDGERIFLIGSGPSIKETPMGKLTDEYSLAMNKINHVYSDTTWRPSFYYYTKKELIPKEHAFIQDNINEGIVCFIESAHDETYGEHENVYYVDRQELKLDPVHPDGGFHEMAIEDVRAGSPDEIAAYWSDDPTQRLFTYHSMYGVMQLVTYLGFDELYLLGCDLGFGVHDPHMIFEDGMGPLDYTADEKGAYFRDARDEGVLLKSIVNGLIYKLYFTPLVRMYSKLLGTIPGDEDPNHFTENYREKPKDNRYANEEITKSHVAAKKILSDRGVNVYNATVGGELEVYPRVDIDDLV